MIMNDIKQADIAAAINVHPSLVSKHVNGAHCSKRVADGMIRFGLPKALVEKENLQ